MQIKTKIASCHTADSKLVKQEVISTVILPLLVFPGLVFVSKARGRRHDIRHNDTYAGCRVFLTVMPSVALLNGIMLDIVALWGLPAE